jgi:hypothetical protein
MHQDRKLFRRCNVGEVVAELFPAQDYQPLIQCGWLALAVLSASDCPCSDHSALLAGTSI